MSNGTQLLSSIGISTSVILDTFFCLTYGNVVLGLVYVKDYSLCLSAALDGIDMWQLYP